MIDLEKTLNNAIGLVNMYFHNKVDKGGNPYKNHLFSVAYAVEKEASKNVVDPNSTKAIFYKKAYIVALLHDILEDTDTTEDELYKIGCDQEIVEAIKSVTRKSNERNYLDFIKRASKNDIGRIVKKYDLENNMDIRRLKSFTNNDMKRLNKYWYSWMFLKGEITEEYAKEKIN